MIVMEFFVIVVIVMGGSQNLSLKILFKRIYILNESICQINAANLLNPFVWHVDSFKMVFSNSDSDSAHHDHDDHEKFHHDHEKPIGSMH
jgi:hypothetical protein